MSNPPVCFGKSWAVNAVECKGGLDPTYTNPKDHSHRRDKCDWYSQCAARTCAGQIAPAASATNVIPVQNLARPAPLVTSPVIQKHVPPQPLYPAQYAQYPYPVVPPPVYAHPYQAYYGQQLVPVNQPQPGMQMLSYLTTLEPVADEVHWAARLGHEVVRALAKSGGHTIANFFDHMTFTKPKPPSP